MSKKRQEEFVFAPLGGVGEIGMNLGLYGYGREGARKWIAVDLGITFPSETQPGIERIMPDIRFLEEERDNLLGIVLTHAHEDHYGAVGDLWPRLGAPVYATPFSAGLLRAKMAEERIHAPIPLKEVALGGSIELGPFAIRFVTTTHSIPEPNGLIIETAAGTAYHSGDWKIDGAPQIGGPTDIAALKELGARGCRALICDSTNATREGVSPSEGDVAQTLKSLIAEAPERVAVTAFASNVARLRSVALAAHAAGRRTILIGRAMHRVVTVAREAGYLHDVPDFLTEHDFKQLPRNEVVLLVTGSQGESRAALARIAQGNHPAVSLAAGDRVIFSSRTIPGNEKAVGQVQNALVRAGMDVITDADGLVHVSGHPRRGELVQLYDWLKPEVAIPVHGEARHLAAHAKLARERGVREVVTIFNGDMVRLAPGPAAIIDELPSGRLHKDGRITVAEDDEALRERRRLSFNGLVVVALTVTSKGELVAEPEVRLLGIPSADEEGGSMLELVYDTIDSVITSIPKPRRKDADLLREAVRRGVRATLGEVWGKRPVCEVMVTRI